jgi:hypothetical protein
VQALFDPASGSVSMIGPKIVSRVPFPESVHLDTSTDVPVQLARTV